MWYAQAVTRGCTGGLPASAVLAGLGRACSARLSAARSASCCFKSSLRMASASSLASSLASRTLNSSTAAALSFLLGKTNTSSLLAFLQAAIGKKLYMGVSVAECMEVPRQQGY